MTFSLSSLRTYFLLKVSVRYIPVHDDLSKVVKLRVFTCVEANDELDEAGEYMKEKQIHQKIEGGLENRKKSEPITYNPVVTIYLWSLHVYLSY